MQQIKLHKNFRCVSGIDETEYSATVWERKEKLEQYEKLEQEGCSQETILEILKISRATYFRWKRSYKRSGLVGLENESKRPQKTRVATWTPTIEKRIYHLRKQFPLWGKSKIAVMYKRRYGEKVSGSTVGRILTKLLKQNKIMPVRFLYGKKDTKRRIFNGHAQRIKKDMKAERAGQLIQVDHMTLHMPGIGEVKNFQAICPITKIAVYEAYQTATSKNAKDFLIKMRKEFPFKIESIQVDGGGEFMADFEKECQVNEIPLWVLPPRSPERNGNVERGNGTVKYEFFYQYEGRPTFHFLRKNLQKFASFYNKVRPHQGIDLLTPWVFYESIKERPQSHMY